MRACSAACAAAPTAVTTLISGGRYPDPDAEADEDEDKEDMESAAAAGKGSGCGEGDEAEVGRAEDERTLPLEEWAPSSTRLPMAAWYRQIKTTKTLHELKKYSWSS